MILIAMIFIAVAILQCIGNFLINVLISSDASKLSSSITEIGSHLLSSNKLSDIHILRGKSNEYQYDKRVIVLTGKSFRNKITSLAILSHEIGHATQFREKPYLVKKQRRIDTLLSFSIVILVVGLVLSIVFPGLIIIDIAALFGIIYSDLFNLSLEIDASKRASKMIKNLGYNHYAMTVTRILLSAAALTYLSSVTRVALNLMKNK